jgi:predicted transcriptional regulator of viral defense system
MKNATHHVKPAQLLETLEHSRKVVFTLSDFQKITGGHEAYTRILAGRLAKTRLRRIERGKYTLAGNNPFLVASNLLFPSYLSFITAHSYYGVTTQLPRTIYVVGPKQKKTIEYDGIEIRFVKFPTERLFGYKREILEGKYLFIARLEKAIVDSVYLPRYCPVSETFRVLSVSEFDAITLAEFAERMDSLALLKRLGFILEALGFKPPVTWARRSTNRVLLNPGLQRTGRLDNRWNLIVNEVLE